MMEKIKLKEIDDEPWRFILYETPDRKWIASFSYSPRSSFDLAMLIELTDEEQSKSRANRQFLVDMAKKVSSDYKAFSKRSLSRENFII